MEVQVSTARLHQNPSHTLLRAVQVHLAAQQVELLTAALQLQLQTQAQVVQVVQLTERRDTLVTAAGLARILKQLFRPLHLHIHFKSVSAVSQVLQARTDWQLSRAQMAI